MPTLINALLMVHVLLSLLIILLVLMQRPQADGLGAAVGSGMTDQLFGPDTGHVLRAGTRWLGGLFLALTLLLSFPYVRSSSEKSTIQKALSAATVPAARIA